MAIAGRVARITTVMAGCGEIPEGPSVMPGAPPMVVSIDAKPPPIEPRWGFSHDAMV
jgi:hypothetical protein